jgi:hypothetical protein
MAREGQKCEVELWEIYGSISTSAKACLGSHKVSQSGHVRQPITVYTMIVAAMTPRSSEQYKFICASVHGRWRRTEPVVLSEGLYGAQNEVGAEEAEN